MCAIRHLLPTITVVRGTSIVSSLSNRNQFQHTFGTNNSHWEDRTCNLTYLLDGPRNLKSRNLTYMVYANFRLGVDCLQGRPLIALYLMIMYIAPMHQVFPFPKIAHVARTRHKHYGIMNLKNRQDENVLCSIASVSNVRRENLWNNKDIFHTYNSTWSWVCTILAAASLPAVCVGKKTPFLSSLIATSKRAPASHAAPIWKVLDKMEQMQGIFTIIADMKKRVPRTASKRYATSFLDSESSAFFFSSSISSSFFWIRVNFFGSWVGNIDSMNCSICYGQQNQR